MQTEKISGDIIRDLASGVRETIELADGPMRRSDLAAFAGPINIHSMSRGDAEFIVEALNASNEDPSDWCKEHNEISYPKCKSCFAEAEAEGLLEN